MKELIVLLHYIAVCKIIAEFQVKLHTNLEDLDPEFQKAVDENFWDLV